MSQAALEEVISSRARLRIADLLSVRPRTLKELADLTGISVQGVLKHLERLDRLGLVSEQKLRGSGLAARKIYSIKGVHLGDFSYGDLTVVKLSKRRPAARAAERSLAEVERLSEDALIQKRRIRDQTRKLGRLIEELVDDQAKMAGIIASLRLSDEERLILQVAFTEESIEDAERSLRLHYGIRNAGTPLERAINKAKRIGKK